MLKRPCCVLLVVVAVAGCGSGGSSASSTTVPFDPKTLALRLSDLPKTFKVDAAHYWSVAETASDSGARLNDYQAHGGGQSYEETFVLRFPTGTGVSFVTNRVFTFANANDAMWGYDKLNAYLSSSGVNGTEQVHLIVGATPTPLPTRLAVLPHPVGRNATPYEAARVASVGQEDVGFTVESVAYAGEYDFENDLVLFRQGRFCGTVRIAGTYNQVPWSMAVELARTVAARMKAAS